MDGMFTELFKPILKEIGYGVTVEEVRHSTQKEKRIIDTLEPVLNQHRLAVASSVIEADFNSTRDLPPEQQLHYQLFYQLTRITKDRGALVQDDRLDALSMAVAYWVEQMAADVEEEIEARKARLLQDELDGLMRAAQSGLAYFLGGNPTGSGNGSWRGSRGR